VKYSPTRFLGALRRRELDWFRGFVYRSFRGSKLSNSILFESFQGKVIGDNPYAIFSEVLSRNPSFELLFTVNSKTKAPDGAKGVKHGSIAWLKALATSRVLVNNTNFPGYFRKRDGQLYIQTWHGTPLKRLGRDIVEAVPTGSYLRLMDREASYWDFLISPSGYCSEIFPRTFGYKGNILETGYPRNDILVNQVSKRDLIRRSLGITDSSQLVVLYAPTWRDSQRTATGNWKPVNFLEGSLDENVTVLFRGHTNTHSAHNSKVTAGAIDVTNYKNVAELYLAADVLVTDYSSSMFDFSVTGKPMIFLTPDFDDYVAKRGFYFDFEQLAPGPILRDPSFLRKALESIDSQKVVYAERYQAWQQKFNKLEDGLASKRVVDATLTAFHSLFSEH
jgi:CDP-glycerol glycerophosphotransferase